MSKDDIYFAIGAVLAILGLFGLDWNVVRGRLSMPTNSSRRQLAMFAAILGSLIFSGYGFYSSRHRSWSEIAEGRWRKPEFVEVAGKTFHNEKVPLDGFLYRECTFDNVTFVFKGDAPFQFEHNYLHGNHWIDVIGNRALGDLVGLEASLGDMKPGTVISDTTLPHELMTR